MTAAKGCRIIQVSRNSNAAFRQRSSFGTSACRNTQAIPSLFWRNQGGGKKEQNLFYPAYVNASNFAVGVFMAGAGYSESETTNIASAFAIATSGPKKGKEIIDKDRPMWQAGWNYGQQIEASREVQPAPTKPEEIDPFFTIEQMR